MELFPEFRLNKKGKLDRDKFIEFALINGEIQEGDMERKAKTDHMLGEIVEFINEHLVDINTGKLISHEMLRNLLKQINFKVMSNKSVKASALHAISILVAKFDNLQRTFMKIKVELLATDKQVEPINVNITPKNEVEQLEIDVSESEVHVCDLFRIKMNEILKEH